MMKTMPLVLGCCLLCSASFANAEEKNICKETLNCSQLVSEVQRAKDLKGMLNKQWVLTIPSYYSAKDELQMIPSGAFKVESHNDRSFKVTLISINPLNVTNADGFRTRAPIGARLISEDTIDPNGDGKTTCVVFVKFFTSAGQLINSEVNTSKLQVLISPEKAAKVINYHEQGIQIMRETGHEATPVKIGLKIKGLDETFPVLDLDYCTASQAVAPLPVEPPTPAVKRTVEIYLEDSFILKSDEVSYSFLGQNFPGDKSLEVEKKVCEDAKDQLFSMNLDESECEKEAIARAHRGVHGLLWKRFDRELEDGYPNGRVDEVKVKRIAAICSCRMVIAPGDKECFRTCEAKRGSVRCTANLKQYVEE